ncbi:MAG: hypothetical protein ACM3WU_05060 [Bacillota bacterium]
MSFLTERDMVDTFIASGYMRYLLSTGATASCEVEPQGLFGIPDIVVIVGTDDGEARLTYAFESKLSNWRRALVQAYRYKAFAEFSFVLMDDAHIGPALKHTCRFAGSNIGLLSINEHGFICVHVAPTLEEPFSCELRTAVRKHLSRRTGLQPAQQT